MKKIVFEIWATKARLLKFHGSVSTASCYYHTMRELVVCCILLLSKFWTSLQLYRLFRRGRKSLHRYIEMEKYKKKWMMFSGKILAGNILANWRRYWEGTESRIFMFHQLTLPISIVEIERLFSYLTRVLSPQRETHYGTPEVDADCHVEWWKSRNYRLTSIPCHHILTQFFTQNLILFYSIYYSINDCFLLNKIQSL